jgi:hypothetical protein
VSALGAADGVPENVSGINVLNRADAVVLEDLARRVDAGEPDTRTRREGVIATAPGTAGIGGRKNSLAQITKLIV